MKVLVTDAAWEDLLAIGRRIQIDNPTRAGSFVEELYDCCRELADMPFAFASVRGREAARPAASGEGDMEIT